MNQEGSKKVDETSNCSGVRQQAMPKAGKPGSKHFNIIYFIHYIPYFYRHKFKR